MPSTSEILTVANEKGMNVTKFAARFGISHSTARQWLKSIGYEKWTRKKVARLSTFGRLRH